MNSKFIFWISLIWSNTAIIMLYHYLPTFAALEASCLITVANAGLTYVLLKTNESNEEDE